MDEEDYNVVVTFGLTLSTKCRFANLATTKIGQIGHDADAIAPTAMTMIPTGSLCNQYLEDPRCPE